MKSKLITPQDKENLRKERLTRRYGFLLVLHDWLKKEHPNNYFKLHPSRNVLSISYCYMHQRNTRYNENIIVSEDAVVRVNNSKLIWLGEKITKKIDSMFTSEIGTKEETQ